MLAEVKDFLQVAIQIATIVTILYGLYKFTRKPHDTLDQKYESLKTQVDEQGLILKEQRKSLDASHEKHRQQEDTNATFKSVMLAFINFEIAYCRNTGYEDNQDLLDAKKELSEYLTGKRHHEKEKD